MEPTPASKELLKENAIAVVIPCYNVERHITDVVNTIPDYVRWIIAVNDCTPDNGGDVLEELSKSDERLVVITHDKNMGVGGAMKSGYVKALELEADIVIKMDGDGQMDPLYIDALIEPLISKNADFSKGNRFRDFTALRQMPLLRRMGNLGLSFMIKTASGYWNVFDPTNGYTAINKNTLKSIAFKNLDNRYFFESSMLIELYYTNAVIEDVPMKAIYADEVSGLSATKTLFEFPPKLFVAVTLP